MYRPTAQPRICSLAVRMGDEGKAVGSSHIRPTALLCGHFCFPADHGGGKRLPSAPRPDVRGAWLQLPAVSDYLNALLKVGFLV